MDATFTAAVVLFLLLLIGMTSVEPSRMKRAYYRVRERHHPNVAKIAAARVIMHEVFYRWSQAIDSLDAVA